MARLLLFKFFPLFLQLTLFVGLMFKILLNKILGRIARIAETCVASVGLPPSAYRRQKRRVASAALTQRAASFYGYIRMRPLGFDVSILPSFSSSARFFVVCEPVS